MSLVLDDISIRPTYMKLKGYQIQCLIKKTDKKSIICTWKIN